MTATIANFAENTNSTHARERVEPFASATKKSHNDLTVAEATRQRDRIEREDFAALKQILAIG